MNAQERAEKLIRKWMQASPDKNGLNLVSGVWDEDIAAELEAYAEDVFKSDPALGKISSLLVNIAVEKAKAEGRRAGLEEAAKIVDEDAGETGHFNLHRKGADDLIESIRALLTEEKK